MLSFYLSLLSDPADKEKMAQIYKKYRQTMYAAAVEILRSPYDAEDAVHESFIKNSRNTWKRKRRRSMPVTAILSGCCTGRRKASSPCSAHRT